jgi:hypothetical protein
MYNLSNEIRGKVWGTAFKEASNQISTVTRVRVLDNISIYLDNTVLNQVINPISRNE